MPEEQCQERLGRGGKKARFGEDDWQPLSDPVMIVSQSATVGAIVLQRKLRKLGATSYNVRFVTGNV